MPIASAMTAAHRDSPAVASVAQWPEIQLLVSRGQIISADLAPVTDGRTDTLSILVYWYMI